MYLYLPKLKMLKTVNLTHITCITKNSNATIVLTADMMEGFNHYSYERYELETFCGENSSTIIN